MELPFTKMEKTVWGASLGVGGNQELSFEYTKFEMPFKYPSGDIEMDIHVCGS